MADRRTLILIATLAAGMNVALASYQGAPKPKDWIQLFNGRNLDGWVPKITGYALGENFGDTFGVKNGVLRVSYDKYSQFGGKFGHLFYQRQKFSYYRVAAEYRFVGEQVPGGPNWALRNNGLMLHSQAPGRGGGATKAIPPSGHKMIRSALPPTCRQARA